MIVEEMFNRRSLEAAAEIFAADFVDRRHERVAGKKDGPEGFAQFVKSIRSALPDLRAAIQNMVAEGDYVSMWNTATATHHGELFGMPPSGKQIHMRDFHFFRFSNGNRRALELHEHFLSLAEEIEGMAAYLIGQIIIHDMEKFMPYGEHERSDRQIWRRSA